VRAQIKQTKADATSTIVIPANAGFQWLCATLRRYYVACAKGEPSHWIPAFAGMTEWEIQRFLQVKIGA